MIRRSECHRVRAQLIPFLRGTLTPSLHEQVQSHLHRCAQCQAKLRTIEPVVRLLSKKPEVFAPTPVSADFDQRLEHVIQAEILRQNRRRPWWQALWPIRRTNRRLTASVLAMMILGVISLSVLPIRADTLAEALHAVASCKSIHVWGESNAFSLDKATESYELWWGGDDRCWLQIGDHELLRYGERAWIRFAHEDRFIKQPFDLSDVSELTSPRKYLEHLCRSRTSGARLFSTASGNVEIIKVLGEDRSDRILINRTSKLLAGAETHVRGKKHWYRLLVRFVYNEPMPDSVAAKFHSVMRKPLSAQD